LKTDVYCFFTPRDSLVIGVFARIQIKQKNRLHAAAWESLMWDQIYNPLNSKFLSTCAAALPVVTLLALIASNRVKAHIAAVIALIVANFVAIVIFTMPADMSLRASILGAVTGFFPIGWIVLNVIFLYRLTVEKGVFQTLQTTIGGVTEDRRLQLLLIAFSFGAFFEGASGFGTPVAVTGAILIGLGFSPLAASGLSLIANTAPVAYGALGTPIAGLASVTDLDPFALGAMVGRQLPFFSLIVPFWLIWAFAGYRGMKEVWPAILVTGVSFAISAVPDLEFYQSVDRRHRRFADIDGLPDRLPEDLETKNYLDIPCPAHTRRFSRHDGQKAGEALEDTEHCRSVVRPDALDHRLRNPAAVGN
jgi:L-lactate permease